jgi:hypothetical protein
MTTFPNNAPTAHPVWVRVALVVLAVPNLVAGLWAVVAPRSWFDTFPGWAPHLVAAHPPFNDHLATDAGAGLLAAGVLAAVALVIPRREVVLTAMLGVGAFVLPHAVFHVLNPAGALSSFDDALNSGSLVAVVVLTAAVATHAWRQR